MLFTRTVRKPGHREPGNLLTQQVIEPEQFVTRAFSKPWKEIREILIVCSLGEVLNVSLAFSLFPSPSSSPFPQPPPLPHLPLDRVSNSGDLKFPIHLRMTLTLDCLSHLLGPGVMGVRLYIWFMQYWGSNPGLPECETCIMQLRYILSSAHPSHFERESHVAQAELELLSLLSSLQKCRISSYVLLHWVDLSIILKEEDWQKQE